MGLATKGFGIGATGSAAVFGYSILLVAPVDPAVCLEWMASWKIQDSSNAAWAVLSSVEARYKVVANLMAGLPACED